MLAGVLPRDLRVELLGEEIWAVDRGEWSREEGLRKLRIRNRIIEKCQERWGGNDQGRDLYSS